MALVLVKSPEGCHTQGGETQLPALISLADQATEYAKAAKASETRRGYASDLKRFAAFCEALGVEMLPASPPTVALYLTHLAQAHAVATIRRHMVAIAQAHKNTGLPSPVADPHVRSIVQGITRTKGTAQRKKTALSTDASFFFNSSGVICPIKLMCAPFAMMRSFARMIDRTLPPQA
jgi:hypothetical protein